MCLYDMISAPIIIFLPSVNGAVCGVWTKVWADGREVLVLNGWYMDKMLVSSEWKLGLSKFVIIGWDYLDDNFLAIKRNPVGFIL